VGVGSNVTATFSEAVQGVGGTTFTLRNASSGVAVSATVSYDAATRVATLNPVATLSADTRYTAALTGGTSAIRDTAGNPLTSTSWTFLNGPRPTITSKTPAANATTVVVGSNVTATFNEGVQGVSGTTFTLRNASSGVAVSATVVYDAATRVATLDPSTNLAAGTSYRATLTGGASAIRDVAGNPLATINWTFSTAGV
jgi:uncharacterized protein YciW